MSLATPSRLSSHPQSTRSEVQYDLPALLALRSRALAPVYGAGRIHSIDELGENPRGQVLAVVGLDGPLVGVVAKQVTTSALFPWEGKSFHGRGTGEGRGYNRLRSPVRRALFSFRTCISESLIDGQPCLAIDYDVPENPALVRATYDEVRSVGPGLYLGRGMRRTKSGPPVLLLWFALDAHRQDAALG